MNRTRGTRSLSFALATAAAIVLPAAAQAQNMVSGRIADPQGAPLPGAEIVVPELGIRTATDRQGQFTLPSVPAGPITLNVDYLGFAPASRTFTIAEGQPNIVAITLERADEMGTIVVTGTILDSAARALNQQRTADNLTNVVSSDSIGRFPDTNIAEALQRVPGIGVERDQGEGNFISLRGAPSEFTSITVDGVAIPSSSPDTRAVDLGTLPSDVVNALEVSKTLLPHQDADSIAGSVNLVTRSPFDNPRLRVTASGGASYNEYGDTNDYRASGVVSNVFGNVGALLSASYSKTDRRVDNIESYWGVIETAEGEEILGIPEQEFKDYDTRRERLGLTGALEFRPDTAHRFHLRGTYARRIDDEYRNLLGLVYEDGDIQPGATEQRATWNRARFIKEFRHRILRDETYSLSAGGEHDFAGFSLDYTGSLSRSEQTYPRRQQLVYRSNVRPNLTYDFSGDPDLPYISLFETGEHLDLGNYDFRQSVVRWQDTVQDEAAISANIEIPTSLAGNATTFRFGGRFRGRDVMSDEENYRDRRAESAPDVPLTDLIGNEPSRNFIYDLGNKFDADRAIAYFRAIRDRVIDPETRRIAQSVTTDYRASEDIYAAYGMARIELDRADLILGLRMEHTDFRGEAPNFDEVTETFVINRARSSHTHFFPNATLRYAFSENLIGRLALTRAISRPNYRDNVPRISENADTTGNRIDITQGNPDLRPTLSNNVDAGLEYYFRPLGLVAANAFYKDLSDYRFTLVSSGVVDGIPATITRPENAPSGRIYGFELAYQQQFTFLPGFLSGFGLFANYTWTDARVTLPDIVPGRGTRAPLPNQSRHTYNVALFYETDRFNARVAYTGRSDYVDEFNLDARLDTFWEGREQIDFTTSFDVNRNLNLFFEAKNLTNTAGVRYAGIRERATELEKFGRTFFLGARVNF